MTTLTVTLTDACSDHAGGGEHLTFSLTGFKTATVASTRSDLSEPLTQADADEFVRIVARMAKAGRTLAQANTLLRAGVTVTI